jgi:protein-S-isoprenylcysteine O-methyltransferase Ste14
MCNNIQEDRLSKWEKNMVQGEHPHGDRGQLVCLFLFLAVWILDSFVFRYTTFLGALVPFPIRLVVAILCLVSAVYLTRSGHRAVSEEVQAHPRVLRDGAFARVRHPLYLAALLFYVLLLALSPTILALAVFLVIWVFYNYIAVYEEKVMEQRFGEEYRNYRASVPRWMPKLFVSQ